MLECKWPGFIRVASEADLVLRGRGTKLMCKETAVRVMTIAARNQSFVHPMVDWAGEIRLYFQVAAIAKLRLCSPQKAPFNFGCVDGMAINAADIILQVLRAHEVGVLFAKFVAIKAASAGFSRR